MSKIAVCYVLHDDAYYLAESIASFQAGGDVFAFVSRIPWSGEPGDWEAAARIAQDAGAEVILGEWSPEDTHRREAIQTLQERGYTHILTPDGDEFIEPRLLEHLVKIADAELADRVYIHWNTYWKSPEYVIRPREPFTPLILLDLRNAYHVHIRDYDGGRPLLLPPEYGLMHHLSYSGPDERILRKISTWGHKDEVLHGWLEHVWYGWDNDKLLHNLHPVSPPNYQFAERIAVPEVLQGAWQRFQELTGTKIASSSPPSFSEERVAGKGVGGLGWPRVSVIIPLHGGVDDICGCLESLRDCRDLLQEVIVVDNASPDDADQAAEKVDFVRLLRNEENLGFSAACNQGADAATGNVLIFLNSDTIVPRAGLIRLIEALQKSGSIAAVGPYTNRAGHLQQIDPTYTSLENLDRFAEDFAARDAEDVEVDMLVGFCLAVRRSVWEEIGAFDEQFGMGMFEDNDLSYRIRRAGYRLLIAARSFIHHHGSKTLKRMEADIGAMLTENHVRFFKKWRDDLESGFASHLAGTKVERIVFNPERHPDTRARQVTEMARRADISLCMIVKDEERVLADCLKSAKPFFREIIVVDTGSTDRSKEIAQEAGASVYDFPWTDSFSEARNESLKYAKGRWIFWMDADDTLPFASGEALLKTALHAPREIVGFVVPVQFVDDGSTSSGTRVDHVKLFRNLPGLAFEGRIHEQILPSLRATGGEVARCEALVLHSGYDTSPAGQAKKRLRDAKLLALDLKERPNHPFVLFNLGMTDHYGGEHQTAVSWLRKSIDASQANESHLRKAYALMAVSQRELGDKEACLQTLEEGLTRCPEDPELHFHIAMQLSSLGKNEEAKSHYLQTLQADIALHYSSIDIGILSFKTQHNLANLCLQQGNYREARDWWLKKP